MGEHKDGKPETHPPAEDRNVTAPTGGSKPPGTVQRQQGDQDLGPDSQSAPDSQGMK
jgi:hypothetical protein